MAPVDSPLRLHRFDHLPDGLLDIEARQLHRLLPGPSLLEFPGQDPRPLFVSVLLHGNETTGWEAVRALLKSYGHKTLPRTLLLLIGNVAAAREGLRRLGNQPDYNRVWPGTTLPTSAETALTAELVELMRDRHLFASVDVHNNTGLNPHYACVNRLDQRFFRLATLFGRLVVYFSHPKGTQSAAFATLCPTVTLECGKSGQSYGTEHAMKFLDACLHLHDMPDHPLSPQDIDLYHTVAQVVVGEEASISFDGEPADLRLDARLDHLNFTELAPGAVLGTLDPDYPHLPVLARNEAGENVTDDFFDAADGRLVLKRHAMPSMLTLDTRIIRQDCLCYLMERMPLPAADPAGRR